MKIGWSEENIKTKTSEWYYKISEKRFFIDLYHLQHDKSQNSEKSCRALNIALSDFRIRLFYDGGTQFYGHPDPEILGRHIAVFKNS